MYRLAVKLGRANVEALGRSLTAKQLMDWEAYARLEPFDETRADYRAASIVQMIANVNRGPKQKPYTLQDFVLRFEPVEQQKKPQTWAEQESIFKLIAASFAAEKGTKRT